MKKDHDWSNKWIRKLFYCVNKPGDMGEPRAIRGVSENESGWKSVYLIARGVVASSSCSIGFQHCYPLSLALCPEWADGQTKAPTF